MANLIKELETVISINGKEANATIEISVEQDEDFTIDDIDFENEEEKSRFERRLNRGDISAQVVFVEVSALGESDTAVLGAVLVERVEDVDQAVNDHGMIQEATDALVKAINSKYEVLKPYFQN